MERYEVADDRVSELSMVYSEQTTEMTEWAGLTEECDTYAVDLAWIRLPRNMMGIMRLPTWNRWVDDACRWPDDQIEVWAILEETKLWHLSITWDSLRDLSLVCYLSQHQAFLGALSMETSTILSETVAWISLDVFVTGHDQLLRSSCEIWPERSSCI